jgi:site-specific DNA-methyltransferase (adenine-specific)
VKKDNCAILIFGKEPFSSLVRTSNLKDWKYDWIWEKNKPTGFLNCNRMPLQAYEIISVFYRKANYYPVMKQRTPQELDCVLKKTKIKTPGIKKTNIYNQGKRVEMKNPRYKYPVNILKFPFKGKRLHPSQKPIALLQYLIQTYTKPGEVVLDFCMGSGSTGIASTSLGRRFVGIEKDDKTFQIAKTRMERLTGQHMLFEERIEYD